MQTYDPTCTAFYACMVAHETACQYENRVANELAQGEKEIVNKLDAARFTPGLWVVPYSDDGYPGCTGNACTPQPYDGPAGWLPAWTASRYNVAFVEDAFRNGIQNERFRIDVQGWMTESEFETMLNQNLASGYFTRTHTTELPATNVLTNSANGATVTPGTQVTFTDTVTGSAPEGAPTGAVAWTVGGTAGVTACASSTTNLNAGPATCTVTVTNPGTVTVSATYGGDENYPVGTSNQHGDGGDPAPGPQVTPAITPSTPNVTPTTTPSPSTTTGSTTTGSTGTTGTTSTTTRDDADHSAQQLRRSGGLPGPDVVNDVLHRHRRAVGVTPGAADGQVADEVERDQLSDLVLPGEGPLLDPVEVPGDGPLGDGTSEDMEVRGERLAAGSVVSESFSRPRAPYPSGRSCRRCPGPPRRSPSRRPRAATEPLAGRDQKAGHVPSPAGTCARTSRTPWVRENLPKVFT